MPTDFPVLDPDSGTLVPVPHWTIGEVAAMFGISLSTARRRVKEGEWSTWEPMAGVHWMTAEQIAEARERRLHPAAPPPPPDLPEAPRRLGTVVDPEDLEGIR